jgi:L-iditol 2-dehydrogenase
MGHGVHGAFARYAVARPDQLFALGEDVPAEEGALVEPLAAAVAAVAENTNVRAGDVALVSGPGPIGLLCALVLIDCGIKTLVAGTAEDGHRLAIARELGASRTIEVGSEDLLEAVREETDGAGVDVAFEVAGVAGSATSCLDALRPLGSYTQIGHFGRNVTLPFDRIGFKQLRVQGSVGYTHQTWDRTIALLKRGLRPSRIVTHRYSIDEWETGFSLFEKKKALKVLLRPVT